MKSLLILLTLVLSILQSPKVLAQWGQSPWNYHNNTCYAFTNCYDYYGRIIGRVSCAVQGHPWSGRPCSWRVVHGYGVECVGLVRNWQGLPVFTPIRRICPGRGPFFK